MSTFSPPIQPAHVQIPPKLGIARDLIASTLAGGERAAIPAESLTAAMLVELMPRLVGSYGHIRVAEMLRRLAEEVLADADASGGSQ